MTIFDWRIGNLIDDEESDMDEIIHNVEHAHHPFIEEKIVDDPDIVENEVGEIHMNEIKNVITND